MHQNIWMKIGKEIYPSCSFSKWLCVERGAEREYYKGDNTCNDTSNIPASEEKLMKYKGSSFDHPLNVLAEVWIGRAARFLHCNLPNWLAAAAECATRARFKPGWIWQWQKGKANKRGGRTEQMPLNSMTKLSPEQQYGYITQSREKLPWAARHHRALQRS